MTATLSAVSSQDVTVTLAYSGTATNTSDYTRSAASITITAGSTSGSVTLTGVDDALDEVDETVIVDIASVSNGTESGTQQVTATLTDDDLPANTAPGAANGTVTTDEDTAYPFSVADFGFSDVDAGDVLDRVRITSLESAGALTLNGTDVTLNQEIAAADITAGGLRFTPASNANGAGYASFGFQVHDGTTYSTAAYTLTVDVTPVNDAPTVTALTLTTDEDVAVSGLFGGADLDGDALTFAIVNNGALGTATVIDAASGAFVYSPARDANGSDTFTFRASDGTAYSATATVTVTIAAVADPIPTQTVSDVEVTQTEVTATDDVAGETTDTAETTETQTVTEALPEVVDTVATEQASTADLPAEGAAEAGVDGSQATVDVATLITTLNDGAASLSEQKAVMASLGAEKIVEGLKNSDSAAGRQAGAVLERVAKGESVTQADLIRVLQQERVDNETLKSNLLAFSIVQKAQRTEMYGKALAELAQLDTVNIFASFAARSGGSIVDPLPKLTGERVAILIGIDDYSAPITSLNTPVKDVDAVGGLLSAKGFQSIVLKNATQDEIIGAFQSVARQLRAGQELIVYFAGHGYLKEDTNTGYWIPSDTDAGSAKKWISTKHLSDYLSKIKSGKIMVISDSCYSGALTREYNLTADSVGRTPREINQRRSVMMMSSGGEEPVMDGGGDGHSVFARQFINALNRSEPNQTGFDLFRSIRAEVVKTSPQTPEYGAMLSAGHEKGGDYLFNANFGGDR